VALTANAGPELAEGRAWLAATLLEVPDDRKAETVRVLSEFTTTLTGLAERLSMANGERVAAPAAPVTPGGADVAPPEAT